MIYCYSIKVIIEKLNLVKFIFNIIIRNNKVSNFGVSNYRSVFSLKF